MGNQCLCATETAMGYFWLIIFVTCLVGLVAASDPLDGSQGDTDLELKPKLKAHYKPSQPVWYRVNQGQNIWTPRYVPNLSRGVTGSEMFLPLRIRMLGLTQLFDMVERSGLAEELLRGRHQQQWVDFVLSFYSGGNLHDWGWAFWVMHSVL